MSALQDRDAAGRPLRTRRALLRAAAALAALAAVAPRPVLAEDEPTKPSDRGIGGTGITARPQGPGIGFFGTLQRFGSIYVNEVRIRYPDDVEVRIDGRKATAADLRIGQVIRTIAWPDGTAGKDSLATRSIEIVSEVIGPVETVGDGEITVLGQRVATDGLVHPRRGSGPVRPPAPLKPSGATAGWKAGDRVAVSGLRRADGVIAASLIEPAGRRGDQLAGVPEVHGWTLRLGGQRLRGIGTGYAGRRVLLRGRLGPKGFVVSRVRLDGLPYAPGVERVSIESYVERRGSGLWLGSSGMLPGTTVRNRSIGDLVASGAVLAQVPGPAALNSPGAGLRAVLNADIGLGGRYRLDSIQPQIGAGGRRSSGGDSDSFPTRFGAPGPGGGPSPADHFRGDPPGGFQGSPGGGNGGGNGRGGGSRGDGH